MFYPGVYLDSVTEFTVNTATVQPKGVGNVKVILTNPSGTLTEAIVKKNDDDTYTCLYTPFEEGILINNNNNNNKLYI